MAIFGKKEKESKKAAPKKTASKKVAKKVAKPVAKKDIKTTSADLTWVLIKPRITERSAILSEKKVYVFQVSAKANKKQIAEAIKIKFGVAPVKVNTVVTKPKKVIRYGRWATKPEFKKAYVYLNPADTIEFV
jgi:large subunit ribosomal protein L23